MKKAISLILILSLILCGCTAKTPAETTVPTEEPTQAPTTVPPTTEMPTEAPTKAPTEAPTEPPAPTDPLTGETLEAPLESRVFAVTINNVPGAMPVYGVSKADLFFEMFVNDYCTRGLAMFSDISQVKSVGSIRSMRYNFTDLCQTFDAVPLYAGGSWQVLNDLSNSGLENMNVGATYAEYYYRDQSRLNAGYAIEHCLFVMGEKTVAEAEKIGIRVTQDADKDYGLRFTEDGTPAEGEDAAKITIDLIHHGVSKKTIMEYDAEQGKYQFFQYGRAVYDGYEKQNIYFENVIVMLCNVYNDSVYHVAELIGSGEGFFACGGKIIPIKWSHESDTAPILFTLADGTPLELGVGNSYIALAPLTSSVVYE